MPMTFPVCGYGSASVSTTNETYQCPRASRQTRTELGTDGSGRDHATRSAIPGDGQMPVTEAESLLRVVHRGQGPAALPELRQPCALPDGQLVRAVLGRLRAALAEVPDGLLLRDRTAFAEPFVLRAPAGELLVEPGRAALALVLPRLPGLGGALVPDPAAAVPLAQERTLGGCRDASPVG